MPRKAMTVVALAGQRIDWPGRETPRFPASNGALVSERIRRQLVTLRARVLVCSAACGADLLALGEAGALGIRRHVVLPFDASRFRGTSVADCPGDWLVVFDRIVREIDATGDLETLDHDGTDMDAYGAVNRRILAFAQSLATAESMEPVAVIVWDGPAATGESVTAAFAREARTRALRVVEVPTTIGDPRRL
jgi:hypothetical protein